MEKYQEIIKEEQTIGESIITNAELQSKLCTQIMVEQQVVIHCSLPLRLNCHIRLWKSTFLLDKDSSHRSELLYATGINLYPAQWMPVKSTPGYKFTMVFSSLPKNCKSFDLYEYASTDPGHFSVDAITRNRTDVYQVELKVNKV